MSDPTILPLALDGVSFGVGGKHLIQDFTWTFEAGPRTVILGPNGAGKSLLLRLCHGLLQPSAGTVAWLGKGSAEASRRQAMVFQRPVMLRRSATANVDYALKLKGLARAERMAAAADVLGRTGLSRLAEQPARVLSIGEQQRLALARAWALAPEVLFLDEPTASLDPSATHAVEKIITTIHAAGTRIIMTTHDLGQAKRMADEVLFLHRGRLVEHAPNERFFSAPENDLTQAFVSGELLWWHQGRDNRHSQRQQNETRR